MPIYDYTCSACGHLAEVIHGINDHGPRFCPECGAEGTMTKAFTTPAIHFKGSGWAKKDRSSASRSSTAKKDESKKEESKTSTSGEAGASGGATSGDSKGSSSGDTTGSSSSESTGSSSGSTAAAAD